MRRVRSLVWLLLCAGCASLPATVEAQDCRCRPAKQIILSGPFSYQFVNEGLGDVPADLQEYVTRAMGSWQGAFAGQGVSDVYGWQYNPYIHQPRTPDWRVYLVYEPGADWVAWAHDGVFQINLALIPSNPDEREWLMAHEVGHVYGWGHAYEDGIQVGSPACGDSVMHDSWTGSNPTSPTCGDRAQIAVVYPRVVGGGGEEVGPYESPSVGWEWGCGTGVFLVTDYYHVTYYSDGSSRWEWITAHYDFLYCAD